jgi:hypothetical protein
MGIGVVGRQGIKVPPLFILPARRFNAGETGENNMMQNYSARQKISWLDSIE